MRDEKRTNKFFKCQHLLCRMHESGRRSGQSKAVPCDPFGPKGSLRLHKVCNHRQSAAGKAALCCSFGFLFGSDLLQSSGGRADKRAAETSKAKLLDLQVDTFSHFAQCRGACSQKWPPNVKCRPHEAAESVHLVQFSGKSGGKC